MGEEKNIAPKNEELNVTKYETENIKNLIYTIRGKQVMLDSDVASLYNYTTKRINETVRRNIQRFPMNFCFQLTDIELENLRSQFATSSLEKENYGGRRYLPYVFLDIQKFNKEYPTLKIARTNQFHDRFIVIDNKELYHIGASLKDLGKKCFAISKIEDMEYIEKINQYI
ncbi:MAG: ORF6N domain-containing protein [Clostridia bacterium]|nr:ORF6N domain-containing protein [Clostridia bacterium]